MCIRDSVFDIVLNPLHTHVWACFVCSQISMAKIAFSQLMHTFNLSLFLAGGLSQFFGLSLVNICLCFVGLLVNACCLLLLQKNNCQNISSNSLGTMPVASEKDSILDDLDREVDRRRAVEQIERN